MEVYHPARLGYARHGLGETDGGLQASLAVRHPSALAAEIRVPHIRGAWVNRLFINILECPTPSFWVEETTITPNYGCVAGPCQPRMIAVSRMAQ